MSSENLIIDFAIYGKANNQPDIDYSEILEDKVYELNGIKTLISRNHYSPERFWKIYSKERYSAAKSQLDPDGLFADIYTKFHNRTS
jgi:hypothetical protein